MSTSQSREFPTTAVVLLLVLLLLVGGIVFLFATVSISGTAALPNGKSVSITSGPGGFAVAENRARTNIDLGGRRFEFNAATVVVDGITIGMIDDSTEQISLSNTRKGVSLVVDGKEIELPK